MRVLRPRTLIVGACLTWAVTIGVCLYAASLWSSYERMENRQRVPSRASRLLLAPIPPSKLHPVKPGLVAPRYSPQVSMRESGLSRPGILRSTMGREPESSIELQVFEDGAARKDVLMTLREKPQGSETELPGLRSHRPKGERGARYAVELSQAGIKPGRHLQTLATSAARLCGLTEEETALFHSLIYRESTWRHYDARGRVLRSSAGALGLTQVLPSTARELGLDARDVWQNALAGACTLRRNLDRHQGNYRAALHDYHAGPWRKRTVQATINYANDIIEGSN